MVTVSENFKLGLWLVLILVVGCIIITCISGCTVVGEGIRAAVVCLPDHGQCN